MGTPDFAVPSLARLVRDGHDIVAVFTQPDKPAGRGKQMQAPPVKVFALEHGLTVYQPARIKTNEEVRSIFEESEADTCVVAAYGKILPAWMLTIPRLGCLNVHASLLPRYRGAAPINWAIAEGCEETGVTIMQMDIGLDTGGMFSRRATRIGADETAVELTHRLAELGADLLAETLPKIERGEIEAEPQEEAAATYAPLLKREDGQIDWRWSAKEIADRVRAFQPWPAVYTTFRGSRLLIWRAREVEAEPERSGEEVMPATVTAIAPAGFTVACADSTRLRVEEVQAEGKRRVPARDFLNGARLEVGNQIADSIIYKPGQV